MQFKRFSVVNYAIIRLKVRVTQFLEGVLRYLAAAAAIPNNRNVSKNIQILTNQETHDLFLCEKMQKHGGRSRSLWPDFVRYKCFNILFSRSFSLPQVKGSEHREALNP